MFGTRKRPALLLAAATGLATLPAALTTSGSASATPTDVVAPTCTVAISNAAPVTTTFTLQDAGSGLGSITVAQSDQASTPVPAFTSGTTDPVTVTATRQSGATSDHVVLSVADVAGNTVTCTPTVYGFSGATSTFTVPAGVKGVTADLLGGAGGNVSTASGGKGGYTIAHVATTAGDAMPLNVGGRGGDGSASAGATGGFNGGGSASYIPPGNTDLAAGYGAGGGGASDLRGPGGTSSDRRAVAGGGGGASHGSAEGGLSCFVYDVAGGAGGGNPAGDGTSTSCTNDNGYAEADIGGQGGAADGPDGMAGSWSGGGGGAGLVGGKRGNVYGYQGNTGRYLPPSGGGGGTGSAGPGGGATTAGVQSGNGQVSIATITNALPPSTLAPGSGIDFQFTADGFTDAVRSPDTSVTWSVGTGSLPAGLTLSSDGHLTGTATGAGLSTFTVKAQGDTTSLGVTRTSTQSMTIDVPDETPPSCSVQAQDGPPKQATFTVEDSGSGLSSVDVTTADNATTSVPTFTSGSTDALTVTATKVDETKHMDVELSVTDVAGNPASCSYVDTVAPSISGTPPSGGVSEPYSFTFAIGGDPAPTVTYTGALPPGLALDSNGMLSGTPTKNGTFSFTVNATNGTEPDAAWPVSVLIRPKPSIRIGDATTVEGNSGTHGMGFKVTLSRASSAPVTVKWATADGSAKAPSDYVAASGTLTFAPGQTAKTITVQVKGDKVKEGNEVMFVLLSSPVRATLADPNASGGILNDDH
jgi:hypothetical protein